MQDQLFVRSGVKDAVGTSARLPQDPADPSRERAVETIRTLSALPAWQKAAFAAGGFLGGWFVQRMFAS